MMKSRLAGIAVAALASVWMMVDAGGVVLNEIRLRDDVRATEAVIVEKSQSLSARSRWYRRLQNQIFFGHASTLITYKYHLPDGTEVTHETPVSPATWDSLTEGGSIPVRYSVSQPSVSRPEGESRLLLSLFRLALGALFGALAWLAVRAARQRQAARSQRVS
jgi:hypothetical protein